ncbi:hypothetical protein [Streptomyces sp. NPDC048172]|uniref:hypothetical protein n=1 Tax=Streptomyces sp. NPDC048172 TaxID=3365505 RepID=UPI0037214390
MELTERRRRRAVPGLVAGAALCAVAGGVGAWSARPGGLLLLSRTLHHPALFTLLGLGALTAAVLLGVRNRAVRTLAAVCAGTLVLAALAALALSGLTGGTEVTQDEAAPRHTDRHLVVEKGTGTLDPRWRVYVHEGSGLTERRRRIGDFNGDAASNALTTATWSGPDRVRLVTGEGDDARTYVIALDPHDASPSRTIDRG